MLSYAELCEARLGQVLRQAVLFCFTLCYTASRCNTLLYAVLCIRQAFRKWRAGKSPYLFIVNNDVLVPDGCLTALTEAMSPEGTRAIDLGLKGYLTSHEFGVSLNSTLNSGSQCFLTDAKAV